MKKLISMLLAAVMLASMSAISVFASVQSEYPFLDYYKFGTSNGYDICIINAHPALMELSEVIGDYLFYAPNLPGGVFEEQSAVYAVKNGEQIYIKDACEKGLIHMDEVAEMVDGFHADLAGTSLSYDVIALGDVNTNKKLEVADAVIIQKIIAKSYSASYFSQLCDLNKNGEISVEDVLLLQKKIAKAL